MSAFARTGRRADRRRRGAARAARRRRSFRSAAAPAAGRPLHRRQGRRRRSAPKRRCCARWPARACRCRWSRASMTACCCSSMSTNDGVFSAAPGPISAPRCAGCTPGRGERYGWPVDYRLGTVALDNRQTRDWPRFLGRAAAGRDRSDPRPALARAGRAAGRAAAAICCPPRRRPPSSTAICGAATSSSRDGRLAALIDPACYDGHAEVDLAMLDPVRHAARRILGGLWRARARVGGAAAALPALPRAGASAAVRRHLCRHGRPAARRGWAPRRGSTVGQPSG